MPTNHLDIQTPMPLSEARDRLRALADAKRAPRPRDRMALQAAVDLLDAVERKLAGSGH